MKNNDAVLKKYLNPMYYRVYKESHVGQQEIIEHLCNELAAKDEENDNLIGKIEYAISILFDAKIKTGDKDHLLEILD